MQNLKGISLEILVLKTGKSTIYASIREAGKAIDCSPTSIRSVIKLFKDKGIIRHLKKRYLINVK